MLPWRLFCLGYPAFVGPDGEPIRLRTRKHLALLVYLAVEPSVPHRRDRLATLLWPRAGIDEGRHSLATALSVLRARLGGDAFEAGRDTVRLRPGRVVTDVALLRSGDPLEGDIPAALFLEEFEIPHANDFSDWVDAERTRLLPLIHRQLAERIAEARRVGDVRQMERLADRLVRIDPLSEHAARARLESRAMAGDRIGALRGYDQWREVLAEELGARPSTEVDQMADRLRRRGLHETMHAPRADVPTEQWQERCFVGRAMEFSTCYDLWQAVRRGEARHLMVRGEDGVGKTAFMNRVSTALALEGAGVARVQCHELERELPFGAVGGLVSSLLELPGSSATPAADLAELGRLVGRVRQRWPSLPQPSDATGEGARLQFTEAVLALVGAVADEQPVVLVIDDLHLADATSLAVLHLVLRRLRELPVFALLSSSEAASGSVATICRFLASSGTTRLRLEPLGPVASGELLDALFAVGDDPGPSVRRAIQSGAGGVPLILELLVEDWRRSGSGSLALTLSAMTEEGGQPRAAVVAELVSGTLAALEPDTRAVVDLGAILGQRLNDLSMYTLVDLPIARTMRAMGTLTAARLLRDAGSHLEFANEVVRAQCYAAMATPMRRLLHARVADRLLAADGGEAPIGGLEIAWHLVRGDRLAEAVPYLLAGGRESIRRGGPHEADLALSTGLPALTGAPRRTAILLLAEALQELGRWQESLVLLETSNESWAPEEEYLREVLGVVSRRFLGNIGVQDLDNTVARLCELACMGIALDIRVRALAAVPYLQTQSRNGEGLRLLGAAIASFNDLPLDPYQELHLALATAWWHMELARFDDAVRILETGRRIANDNGFRSSVAVRVHVGSAVMKITSGEYSEGHQSLLTALDLAERLDNDLHRAVCASGLAIAAGRLGNYQDQIAWSLKALGALPQNDWSMLSISSLHELASGLVSENRDTEALNRCDDLAARTSGACPLWAEQASLLMRADIYWLVGKREKALRCATAAIRLSDSEPLINDLCGAFARWTARVGVSSNQPAVALERLTTGPLATRPLHRKDQIELLASVVQLEEALGAGETQSSKRLERELATVGGPVRAKLARLGLLKSS
ncbi:MAG TPA: AAA family ATPase [Gemmatimonadales bacterium]|nr:AAA family ATPase [Gemmatimonadales bacterium]